MCYVPQSDFVVTQEPVLLSYEMDISGKMEFHLQKWALIFLDDLVAFGAAGRSPSSVSSPSQGHISLTSPPCCFCWRLFFLRIYKMHF